MPILRRRTRRPPLLTFMLLVGGCALAHTAPRVTPEVDADLERDGGSFVTDAPATLDASACVVTGPERCNGVDDDCNGLTDDGIDCDRRRAIATGANHTCARVGDTVRCWGWNSDGQLGNGTTTDSPTAVVVVGLSGVAEIAAGSEHSCARLVDHTVRCWGDNRYGELGDGSGIDSATPVTVSGLAGVVEITASDFHTCARMQDHTVRCWGRNGTGQLGVGDTMDRSTPEQVLGVIDAVAISAGGNLMETGGTCALLSDRTARCWGQSYSGQLGSGVPMTFSASPVAVVGLADVAAIAVGDLQTCAVLSDRTARCWGDNGEGQLGNGTTTLSSTPVVVEGLTDVAELTSGNAQVCARLIDGTVRCWGNNGNGQLGTGDLMQRHTPAMVLDLTDVAEISAGPLHTCAMRTDGTVRCWGDSSFGQLGDGSTMTTSAVPVTVVGVP